MHTPPPPATLSQPPLPDNWPADGDPALAGLFFEKLTDMCDEVMARRPHWCLEMTLTRGKYQGQGAGGMLMRWRGCGG